MPMWWVLNFAAIWPPYLASSIYIMLPPDESPSWKLHLPLKVGANAVKVAIMPFQRCVYMRLVSLYPIRLVSWCLGMPWYATSGSPDEVWTPGWHIFRLKMCVIWERVHIPHGSGKRGSFWPGNVWDNRLSGALVDDVGMVTFWTQTVGKCPNCVPIVSKTCPKWVQTCNMSKWCPKGVHVKSKKGPHWSIVSKMYPNQSHTFGHFSGHRKLPSKCPKGVQKVSKLYPNV